MESGYESTKRVFKNHRLGRGGFTGASLGDTKEVVIGTGGFTYDIVLFSGDIGVGE